MKLLTLSLRVQLAPSFTSAFNNSLSPSSQDFIKAVIPICDKTARTKYSSSYDIDKIVDKSNLHYL